MSDSTQAIKAKVLFDESSHLAAFRLHMWHRYGIWLMIRTFLSIVLILAGVIMFIGRGGMDGPFPVLMIMVGTFALLRPLIWKIMHARTLRKLPGYGQVVLYTFTPEAVEIDGESQQGRVEWQGVFETYRHAKGLFLYHSKRAYSWIPAESFDSPEDLKTVAEWATK